MPEQGYSLKIDREYGVLLRNRAEIERRTVKEVVQEAIRCYESAQEPSPPGSGLNGLLHDIRKKP